AGHRRHPSIDSRMRSKAVEGFIRSAVGSRGAALDACDEDQPSGRVEVVEDAVGAYATSPTEALVSKPSNVA
ncbi:MAG: hypothetical protein WA005_01950, partial [Candidatus Binataceae bacterium]